MTISPPSAMRLWSAVLASAIAGECCWVDPVAPGWELPAVLQFETSLLPELLRPLVEDAAEQMQVPIAFPAIVMLLSLGGHNESASHHSAEGFRYVLSLPSRTSGEQSLLRPDG